MKNIFNPLGSNYAPGVTCLLMSIIIILLVLLSGCATQSNCPRGVTWTFSDNNTEISEEASEFIEDFILTRNEPTCYDCN